MAEREAEETTDDGAGGDGAGGGVSGHSLHVGDRLSAMFVDSLPIEGASISVIGALGQSTIGSSDKVAARIEALQFGLGEGPHWDAFHSGHPVLAPRLRDHDGAWPVFTGAVLDLGVGAVFAFPLRVGAATIGVVDLYRFVAGEMDAAALERARTLASSVARPAFRLATSSAGEDASALDATTPEMRREVHQATGMILVQLNVSATNALARLQAHAFTTGETVEFIAQQVVTRQLDFRGLEADAD